MAKELPYFKFEPSQWDNGNIQICTREDKGLFIDLCAMYWSRLGDVPFKLASQKLCNGNATALNSLCDEKIIEVIDGNIFIKFLSEQLNEFEDLSKQNSKNAKDGWEKRRLLKKESESYATASKSQSEIDAIREDKSKEKKIKEDNNKIINKIEIQKVENSIYGDGELHYNCRQYNKETENKYTPEMYNDFLNHWTAPLQKGNYKGKELWRSKDTFSLPQRLSTWHKNSINFNKNTDGNKETYLEKTTRELGAIFERKDKTGSYLPIT